MSWFWNFCGFSKFWKSWKLIKLKGPGIVTEENDRITAIEPWLLREYRKNQNKKKETNTRKTRKNTENLKMS